MTLNVLTGEMSNFIKITTDCLDVDAITTQVSDPSTGAISLFVGTTRNEFNGKKVIRLDYEAYIPMAEKKMERLCDNIRSKWPNKIHNIAIHHRLARVEPTEASVVIAITSAHRKESLDAVQFAIDTLKATVPIWKKEIYEESNDETNDEWKENKECLWSQSSMDQIASNDVSKVATKSEKIQNDVDPRYVQITASNDEIERRMDAFMERKREEINANNVLEFCSRHLVNDEQNEFSCARTDSTGLIRKKDSTSHLRKSTVDNSDQLSIKPSHESRTASSSILPFGLEERVINLEEHLMLKPIQKELYFRLKDIENRVLYLEGLSPEYFDGNSKASSIVEKIENKDSGNDESKAFTKHSSKSNSNDVNGIEETVENMQYKEALSNSLCVINKRIQELQTKLRNTV